MGLCVCVCVYARARTYTHTHTHTHTRKHTHMGFESIYRTFASEGDGSALVCALPRCLLLREDLCFFLCFFFDLLLRRPWDDLCCCSSSSNSHTRSNLASVRSFWDSMIRSASSSMSVELLMAPTLILHILGQVFPLNGRL